MKEKKATLDKNILKKIIWMKKKKSKKMDF